MNPSSFPAMKKKPKKSRHIVTLGMILSRKGGPMQDRRTKKSMEHRHLREIFLEGAKLEEEGIEQIYEDDE